MKIGTRLLFSLYIGFVAASAAYLLYGPSGFVSYRELEVDAQRLDENLTELKAIHAELSAEFDSLRRSGDAVTLRARDLGYLRENEILLDLPSFETTPKSYAVGRIVVPDGFLYERGSVTLTAGVAAMFLAFFVLAGLFSAPHRKT